MKKLFEELLQLRENGWYEGWWIVDIEAGTLLDGPFDHPGGAAFKMDRDYVDPYEQGLRVRKVDQYGEILEESILEAKTSGKVLVKKGTDLLGIRDGRAYEVNQRFYARAIPFSPYIRGQVSKYLGNPEANTYVVLYDDLGNPLYSGRTPFRYEEGQKLDAIYVMP